MRGQSQQPRGVWVVDEEGVMQQKMNQKTVGKDTSESEERDELACRR